MNEDSYLDSSWEDRFEADYMGQPYYEPDNGLDAVQEAPDYGAAYEDLDQTNRYVNGYEDNHDPNDLY